MRKVSIIYKKNMRRKAVGMMTTELVLPELLAPAGDWETLKVGVAAGADAVYLGGKLFSARQSAANFSQGELNKAADYLHLRGRKLYVTVNTLIKQEEIGDLLNFINHLYKIGTDAIIIQDLGVLYLIRKLWPDLPVHASTQMTIHDSAGVHFLQELGVERVILSRELTFDEIKAIHEENQVELEVFVHGALCLAYSGACLFSSLIGGRSGNRGRCAQPCRLTYTLLQENQKLQPSSVPENGRHLLSPKDLCLLASIPDLIEAGVSSLKIEGRMKGPEYVGTVVKTYRRALDRLAESPDQFRVEPEEWKELETVFNRGFSTGYFYGDLGPDLMSPVRPSNRGRFIGRVKDYDLKRKRCLVALEEEIGEGDGIEVWVKVGGRVGTIVEDLIVSEEKVNSAPAGVGAWFSLPDRVKPGDRVFLTSCRRLEQNIQQMMRNDYPFSKLPCEMKARIAPEEPLMLMMKALDYTVTVYSSGKASVAEKHPLTEETLRNHLTRLGETPFLVKDFSIEIEGEAILPFSQLNQVRREAVELLSQKILIPFHHQPIVVKNVRSDGENNAEEHNRFGPSFLTVYAGNIEILKQALAIGVQKVIFGGESFIPGFSWNKKNLTEAMSISQKKGVKAIIALPRITRERERKRNEEYILTCQQLCPDGFLVSHLGSLQMVRDYSDLPLYANYPFHFFNTYTFKLLNDWKIKGITLSPELSRKELFALLGKEEFIHTEVEILVFGALELMVSQFCPLGAWVGNNPPLTCSRPCQKDLFFLRDRKGIDFPVITDEFCRMHLLNSRRLSLFRELKILKDKNLSLRLELRHQSPKIAGEIIRIYQEGIEKETDEKQQLAIESLLGQSLTRGHFYRGVE